MKDLAFPFAIALAASLMGVDTAVSVLPKAGMADFFEVRSVTAERQGETAVIQFDRVIHQPLHMEFTVRVQGKARQGWVEVCAMSSGVILYTPDAVLPDPVTLDWWTWGKCPTLPEGPARIVTTWAPDARGLEPVTVITEVEG